MNQSDDIPEKVPGTELFIGQPVYFKSIHGDFAIDYEPAHITEYRERETESPDFPLSIAICIQFGPEFNLAKTWGRVDEIFPLESLPTDPP